MHPDERSEEHCFQNNSASCVATMSRTWPVPLSLRAISTSAETTDGSRRSLEGGRLLDIMEDFPSAYDTGALDARRDFLPRTSSFQPGVLPAADELTNFDSAQPVCRSSR